MQREQAGVEMRLFSTALLSLYPGFPGRLQVVRIALFNFLAKSVIGKPNSRGGFDTRIGRR